MATFARCLKSVLGTTGEDTEVIVIDNASSDGTAEVLQEAAYNLPRVRALYNERNLGYSRAANQGVRASSGDFIVLLNPDTLLREGAMERLLSALGYPCTGAAGPVSNSTAGAQYIELHIDEREDRRYTLDELHETVKVRNEGQVLETKLLMGFCLALSRKAVEEVGLLDEEMFLGCDDLDYCWRLSSAGYRLLVACDSFVEHKGQVSFEALKDGEKHRLLTESNTVLARKLEAHYGRGNVPTSIELFGTEIFSPEYPLWPSKA